MLMLISDSKQMPESAAEAHLLFGVDKEHLAGWWMATTNVCEQERVHTVDEAIHILRGTRSHGHHLGNLRRGMVDQAIPVEMCQNSCCLPSANNL